MKGAVDTVNQDLSRSKWAVRSSGRRTISRVERRRAGRVSLGTAIPSAGLLLFRDPTSLAAREIHRRLSGLWPRRTLRRCPRTTEGRHSPLTAGSMRATIEGLSLKQSQPHEPQNRADVHGWTSGCGCGDGANPVEGFQLPRLLNLQMFQWWCRPEPRRGHVYLGMMIGLYLRRTCAFLHVPSYVLRSKYRPCRRGLSLKVWWRGMGCC